MSAKEGRISLVAILTGLTIISVPFSIVSIGGTGILMFVGVPMIVLSIITKRISFNVFRNNKSTYWLLAFILYDVLSFIWSPGSPTVYFRTFIVTLCIILNEYTRKEQKLLLISACLPTVIIFYNIIFGNFTAVGGGERMSIVINGVETDPNYISLCFFPTVAIVSSFLFTSKKGYTIVSSVILLLIVLYCELSMGCRGGLLTCLIILFCSYITKGNISIRSFFFFAIVLLLIFYVFLPYVSHLLPESVSQRFSTDNIFGSEDNMSGRQDIWTLVIAYLLSGKAGASLLFGNGASSTLFIFYTATHNLILQIIVELGIVGLLFFVLFVVSLIKILWKTKNRISFALFVGTLFMSLSLSTNGILYFWINIAMTYVFLQKEQKKNNYQNNLQNT